MEPKQSKVLAKIKRAGVYDFRNSSEEEKEIITYLGHEGYIIYDSDENEPPRAKIHLCSIKQEGRAALYEWRSVRYYRYVPTIVSALALMKSYGLGIDDILTYCMRLLRQVLK